LLRIQITEVPYSGSGSITLSVQTAGPNAPLLHLLVHGELARAGDQLQPAPSLLHLRPVPHPLTGLDCWPCCPSSPSPGPWRAGESWRPAPACSLSSPSSPCTASAYLSRMLALLPLFSIFWSMASWREPETSPACSLSSTPSPCTESAYLSRLLALLPLFSISWSMMSWREPETSSSLLPLFSSFSLYLIRLPVQTAGPVAPLLHLLAQGELAGAGDQLQPAPSLLHLCPVPHPLTCLDCWPCCPSSPSPGPWRAGGSRRPAPACSLSSPSSPCTASTYLSRMLALLSLFSISWSMASWREPETSSSRSLSSTPSPCTESAYLSRLLALLPVFSISWSMASWREPETSSSLLPLFSSFSLYRIRLPV
jgi:hypothetical protein